MAVEVLMATERLLEALWTVKYYKRVDRSSTRQWNPANGLRALDDERRIDGQQLASDLISREQAHRVGRPTLALSGVQTVMAYDEQAAARRHSRSGTRIDLRALVRRDVQVHDDNQIEQANRRRPGE